MLRHAIALALLAGGLFAPNTASAMPVLNEKDFARLTQQTLTYERIKFENDSHVLALALYWEGGSTGEPVDGMRRIAEVIKTRVALNRSDFGGGEFHDVVYHAHKSKLGKKVCQFSFACLSSTKRKPIAGERWELAREVARDALRDKVRPAQEEVAEYYLNPQFSTLKSICWFKTKLVEAGQTGRHIFWRERKAWDGPREEAAEKPEECLKLEAMEEAAKRKAAAKKAPAKKVVAKKPEPKLASTTAEQ